MPGKKEYRDNILGLLAKPNESGDADDAFRHIIYWAKAGEIDLGVDNEFLLNNLEGTISGDEGCRLKLAILRLSLESDIPYKAMEEKLLCAITKAST